jgi:hypothetical protein
MRRNLSAFARVLGENSPGGSVLERDGVVAAVVPSCPKQSVVNAVIYDDGAAVVAAHDELRAAYAEAGVDVWRVWVPEGDRALADWLERAGHRRSGSTRAMALDLREFDSALPGALEWERTRDTRVVALLNSEAYGLPAGVFDRALEALGEGRAHLYLAVEQGTPASCVAAIDAGTDCGI